MKPPSTFLRLELDEVPSVDADLADVEALGSGDFDSLRRHPGDLARTSHDLDLGLGDLEIEKVIPLMFQNVFWQSRPHDLNLILSLT